MSDVHVRTASEVFGVPEAEVTPEQRRAAKAINFPVIYGRTGNTDISALREVYRLHRPVQRGSDRDVLRSLLLGLVLQDFV